MTSERRQRLIELIRERLREAQEGQTPTAQLVVGVSLLTEIVEDLANQIDAGEQGGSDGR